VLSGVEGEMLAVVGRGVTSQIMSARWKAEWRLPSVWPARMAHVRWEPAGPDGAKKIIWDVWS